MSDEQYTIPSAIEQEADVLGTCLAEGASWWKRVEHLVEGASDVAQLFYEPSHYLVATAMQRVVGEGGVLSISSVTDMLLNSPDGSADRLAPDVQTYLTHLQSRGALRNLADLASAVDALSQKLQLRAQLQALEALTKTIKREQPHPNEISGELRQISLNASVSEDTPTFGEIINQMEIRNNIGVAHRMKTGLTKLDELCRGGFEPTRLYVIGARPKVGKTTMAFNMALEALSQDYVVVFASLEMGEQELWSKLLSAQSMVDQEKIQKMLDGKLVITDFEEDERERIRDAEGGIRSADLYTMFAGDLNHGVDSIISRTMRIMQRKPDRPIVIFVDYLQLLSDDTYNKSAAIGAITRKLKLFAIEMGIIVVAMSQINRDGATDGMPGPHHMRDSGNIEQDADTVILLNRPALQDDSQPEHIMDVWVALNRSGRSDWLKAYFMPHIQTITNIDLIWGDDDNEDDTGYAERLRHDDDEDDFDAVRKEKGTKRKKRRASVRDDDDEDDYEEKSPVSVRSRLEFGFPSGMSEDDA